MDTLDTLRSNPQQNHPTLRVRFEEHQGTKPFISGEKEAIFSLTFVQLVAESRKTALDCQILHLTN